MRFSWTKARDAVPFLRRKNHRDFFTGWEEDEEEREEKKAKKSCGFTVLVLTLWLRHKVSVQLSFQIGTHLLDVLEVIASAEVDRIFQKQHPTEKLSTKWDAGLRPRTPSSQCDLRFLHPFVWGFLFLP